jgi:hypothetical protein
MDETILIKDLPPALIASAIEDLANYTVGFHRAHEPCDSNQRDLLGSGVLVSAVGRRAILTAHHVVQVLPTDERIGLMVGRTCQPHTIDARGVTFKTIARGADDSAGPDLALVLLAPSVAGAIAAKRSFANLDTGKDRLQKLPVAPENALWFVQGFLEERAVIQPDPLEEGLTQYFYIFTAVAQPSVPEAVGCYDYLDFPIDAETCSKAPVKWGGMSGGGIWQVRLRKVGGLITHCAPVLSGMVFYQHETTGTQCGVRGHGPSSIYGQVYKAICEP